MQWIPYGDFYPENRDRTSYIERLVELAVQIVSQNAGKLWDDQVLSTG